MAHPILNKCLHCKRAKLDHRATDYACPLGRPGRAGQTSFNERGQVFANAGDKLAKDLQTVRNIDRKPPCKQRTLPECNNVYNGCVFKKGRCIYCAERPDFGDFGPSSTVWDLEIADRPIHPESKIKAGRLRGTWNKTENDFWIQFPSSPDGALLHGLINHDRLIGGKTLKQELEERGYDLTTLKIQCDKKKGWRPRG